MRDRSRFQQTVNGETKTVTLTGNTVGWQVKAWTYTVGDVKTHAEGNPYLHETFTEYADATNAYRMVCHAAVDDPGVGYVKIGPMVSLDEQTRIDDAARVEHAEREQARLAEIFDVLKAGTE